MFLGPGGAQYNVPQMYWRDIGTTTDAVFAHTYAFNEPYGRAIYPLGQLYGNPPAHQVVRFRQLSRAYGAPNVSWWDWQEASGSDWSAVSRPIGTLAGYAAAKTMGTIAKGAVGDLVVWIQEHLVAAGQPVTVDGGFGKSHPVRGRELSDGPRSGRRRRRRARRPGPGCCATRRTR